MNMKIKKPLAGLAIAGLFVCVAILLVYLLQKDSSQPFSELPEQDLTTTSPPSNTASKSSVQMNTNAAATERPSASVLSSEDVRMELLSRANAALSGVPETTVTVETLDLTDSANPVERPKIEVERDTEGRLTLKSGSGYFVNPGALAERAGADSNVTWAVDRDVHYEGEVMDRYRGENTKGGVHLWIDDSGCIRHCAQVFQGTNVVEISIQYADLPGGKQRVAQSTVQFLDGMHLQQTYEE